MPQETLNMASSSNFIFNILQKTSSAQEEKLPSTVHAFSSWVCVEQGHCNPQ